MPDVQTNFKQPKPVKKPVQGVRAQRAGTAAALKRKATTLHSQVVRARGRCERCDAPPWKQLQCAHIVSRRYAATRTDENAAWCLCAACHRYLTENPFEHVLYATKTHGEDGYRALREKAYAGVGKVMKADFWRSEIARLAEVLEGMER
jgi:hypothetical protein